MSTTLDFNPPVESAPPRLAMAPLVDIVLLLICFYLLVMNSMQSRADVALTLPVVAHNDKTDSVPTELVVNVDPKGDIIVNGTRATLSALPGLLAAQLQGQRELRVTIRADAGQRFDLLDEVMDACRDAGVTTVTLRTREGGPTP